MSEINTKAPSAASLHHGFLVLLPRIETHAKIHFRHIRCPDRRADLVAETLAISWRWYVRAVGSGKDPADFPAAFASLAASHARSGRRLCGQERSKNALSRRAQGLHGFVVQTLPAVETGADDNKTLDALRDNTRTPPPLQAAFRCDFPVWLASLQERKRLLAEDFMLGEKTQDAARKHNVSEAGVSQIRRELHRAWLLFHGEAVA